MTPEGWVEIEMAGCIIMVKVPEGMSLERVSVLLKDGERHVSGGWLAPDAEVGVICGISEN